MHIARARWWSGGFLQVVLCACFATVPATAAAPEVGAPPNHQPLLPTSSNNLSALNLPTRNFSLPAQKTPGKPAQSPAAAAALSFYERRDGMVGMAPDLSARFEPDRVELATTGSHLTIQFAGVPQRKGAQPVGEQLQTGIGNFLLGSNPKAWEHDVRMFGRVRYKEQYPSVDLVYRGSENPGLARLKADWIVSPSGKPDAIRWSYAGARRVELEPNGSLRIETESGILHEDAPIAFQTIHGERRPVEAHFRLTHSENAPPEIGFRLGDYDPSETLVIDPVLSYSTYVGGTRTDAATALSLDFGGTVYVAGYTESANAPTSGSIQNLGGSVDAYIFHLSASGTDLVYATFIGGTGDDRALGIDVDDNGNAFVVGFTTSQNFPLVSPIQSKPGGGRDAFIVKLNASGNALLYSTYFGGSGSDSAFAIDVDPFAQPYIAGETTSTNFPLKAAFQNFNAGGMDVFTMKINFNGALVYSTYFGGSGDDGARGIAVSTNQLTPYITGYTWSTNFPVWNPWQAASGGGQDAFILRFNSDANQLVFSSYLGGSSGSAGLPEMGMAVSLDPFNNVYVCGTTSSVNFPLINAYQTAFGGGSQDAWVRKLDSGGVTVYSTFLGGAGIDIATAIKVDANRRAYVAGYTSSTNFPMVSASQGAFGGAYDAFVTQFDATGKNLVYSTIVGGADTDIAYAVGADSTNGNTYIAGTTLSTNFPIQAPYRFNSSGVTDIFVSKLVPVSIPPTPPAFLSVTPNSGSGANVVFTIQVSDANGSNTIDSTQIIFNPKLTGISSCHIAYVPSTNLFFLLNNTASAWLGGLPAGTNTLIQNSQCALNAKTMTVSKLGNVITLTLPITFFPSYAGSKFIWMLAIDQGGLRIDWSQYGIWTSP